MKTSLTAKPKAIASIALAAGLTLPAAIAPTVQAQDASFTDVPTGYWARPFIVRLAKEDVIAGFPDGTFKPDQPVTRAQFAAIVRKAFDKPEIRGNQAFRDVADNYWATPAIRKAYRTGFLSGYPGNEFRPEQKIPKVQALVALASGLKLETPDRIAQTLSIYQDRNDIPDYAKQGIASATASSLVVNYPNVSFFRPNRESTRADIAAFVYQALVNEGRLSSLPATATAQSYVITANKTTPETPDPEEPGKPAANRLVKSSTVLSVLLPGGNDTKMVIVPGETLQTNLELAEPIKNANDRVLLPQGSQIQGRFQPVNISGSNLKGTQYYAQKITVRDTTYDLNATSDPIVATTQQSLSPNDLQGSLATAGAQLLLGRLLGGGVNISNLLGGLLGGGSGLGGGGLSLPTQEQPNGVIIIQPSELKLNMQSDLKVATLPIKVRS